jgi:hypothetical protein
MDCEFISIVLTEVHLQLQLIRDYANTFLYQVRDSNSCVSVIGSITLYTARSHRTKRYSDCTFVVLLMHLNRPLLLYLQAEQERIRIVGDNGGIIWIKQHVDGQ